MVFGSSLIRSIYERIVYHNMFLTRKRFRFKLFLSMAIVFLNLIVYTPAWVYYSIKANNINETNQTNLVVEYDCYSHELKLWFDIFNSLKIKFQALLLISFV